MLQYDPEKQDMTDVMGTAAHRYNTRVEVISFTEDGNYMMSGGQDTNIVLWDVVGREAIARLQGHHGAILGLHGVGTTGTFVSTSADGLLKVWDIALQACVQTLVVCDVASMITSSAYIPHLECVLIGARDESVRVFRIKDRETVTQLQSIARKTKKGIAAIHVVNTGREGMRVHLQGVDRSVEVLVPASNKKNKKRVRDEASCGLRFAGLLYAKDSKISSMVPISGEDTLVMCMADNALQIVDVKATMSSVDAEKEPAADPNAEGPRTLTFYGHQGEVRQCVISSDNRSLSTFSPADGLRTWRFDFDDVTNLRVQCTGLLSTPGLTCVGGIPGSVHFVGGTQDGQILHFYMPDLSARMSVPAHEGGVTCLCVVPGDSSVSFYSGGKDRMLRLWSFDKKWKLKQVTDRSLELSDVPTVITIDSQHKFVAVALQDMTIKVYFFDTHKQFLNLYGHKYAVTSLSICDDCEMLASGSADKNIKLWGLDFGDLHRSIIAHDDYVLSVRFIPKTHYVVSSGKDGTVKMWDADTWSLIQQLPGATGAVHDVAVASDGSFVVSVGADRCVRAFERTDEQLFPQEETQRLMELAIDRETAERSAFDAVKNAKEVPAAHRTTSALHAAERIMDILESIAQGRAKPSLLWSALRDEVRTADMYHALSSLSHSESLQVLQNLATLFEDGSVDNADVAVNVAVRLCRIHYQSIPRHVMNSVVTRLRAFAMLEKERLGHNLAGLTFLQQQIAQRGGNVFVDATAS
jgi:U3 small nucleolar RNA-associated protein 12